MPSPWTVGIRGAGGLVGQGVVLRDDRAQQGRVQGQRPGRTTHLPVLHARARIKGRQEPAAFRSGDRRSDATRSCTTDRSRSPGHRFRQDPATLENPDTWTVMQDPEGNEFCVTSWTTVTGWR